MMVNRRLYKVEIQQKKFENAIIADVKQKFGKKMKLNEQEIGYFVFQNYIENNAYNPKKDKINILLKNNTFLDISEAADTLNISSLSRPVKKWFLCYPKG